MYGHAGDCLKERPAYSIHDSILRISTLHLGRGMTKVFDRGQHDADTAPLPSLLDIGVSFLLALGPNSFRRVSSVQRWPSSDWMSNLDRLGRCQVTVLMHDQG
jgi:hypothetical protein